MDIDIDLGIQCREGKILIPAKEISLAARVLVFAALSVLDKGKTIDEFSFDPYAGVIAVQAQTGKSGSLFDFVFYATVERNGENRGWVQYVIRNVTPCDRLRLGERWELWN